MKATLLADGYIELVSETEEERRVLATMADEDIDMAESRYSAHVALIRFRRSYPRSLQVAAVQDFRDAMLDQVIGIKTALESLETKLQGMWGDGAQGSEGVGT